MAALRNGVVRRFPANILPVFRLSSVLQKRGVSVGEPHNDPPLGPRQYEISRDPEEWKFVTRLLPAKTIPPVAPKPEYPSGWVPPSEKGKTQPYFVERSKSHMIGVYLDNEKRGELKTTKIKRIHGDIWQLHHDVKNHVQEMIGKKIASQVIESNSIIKLKGDHYHWVEQFLLAKGF